MSLFVNAAPFEENNSTIENKKKQRNHTLKKPQKVKLPTITFNDDDSASLADFKPLAPPKMMKEPHMSKDMEQDNNMNNNFIHEGFGNDESFVSEYPQKYSEKPMSRLEQHRQLVSNLKNNIHPVNSSLEMNDCPLHAHDKMTDEQKELNKKISYMIKLLEDQKHEKTEGVFEDVILYSFLGIFMIFLVESFTKAGKYVR